MRRRAKPGFHVLARVVVGPLAALSLTACGGDDDRRSEDERAIRSTMDRFETLSREGYGATICRDLFTPKLVEAVERAARDRDCASEVRRNVHTSEAVVDVRQIDFEGDRSAIARVTVQRGVRNAIYLVKTPSGRWLIRSIRQE